MKATTALLYEVDLNDINALPIGFEVMQENIEFGTHRVLKAHIDYFSANLRKCKYFIFKAPPLPKVVSYSGVAAGVKK